jgi:hypothetical protein
VTASDDRTLPNNLEAERSVLGAIVTNNDMFATAAQVIRGADFFREAHRRIFEPIAAMQHQAQAIDFVTLKNELARHGELEDVGGPAYIASITDGVPRTTNVEYYARIVKENSTLRALIFAANKVITSAYEGTIDEADVNRIAAIASHAAAVGRSPIVTRLSDVEVSTVDWIWEGRFARGKPTLLAGEPGLGKTTTLLELAACITIGGLLPDGARAPLGNVLILPAEDDLADTIRPKIEAMGGDASRVYVFEGICEPDGSRNAVSLVRDMQLLEQAVSQVQPLLVGVDPITAYLGHVDTHRDAEVRAALGPGIDMAERWRFSFAIVGHLNKDAQRAALHRPGGSIAFVAASRVVLALVADPQDKARRLLVPLKSNICHAAPILACRVDGHRLDWEPSPVTNVDVESLFRSSVHDREDPTDAERLIVELLSTKEWPLDAKVALEAGRANGIPDRTLRSTAKRMGVAIRRIGYGKQGRWLWHIPAIPAIPAPIAATNAHVTNVAPMAPMHDSEEKTPINGSLTHIEAEKLPSRAREGFVFDNDQLGTAGPK